jgi:hypothetical protein
MMAAAGWRQPGHILDVTLQEHRPFGEPMTGSLGKNRNKARQTKTLGL